MIAVARHCRQPIGSWAAPRMRPVMTKSTAPAMRKRTPAISNGGIVSTAILMKRYVDPQMR